MRTIYYLTRSYLPLKTGGVLMRISAVKELSKYFAVEVVTPHYKSNDSLKLDNVIYIACNYNLSIAFWLERLGLYEDYLDTWVYDAFKQLSDTIRKDDLIIATSGGELGCIKLGSKLKSHIGCKLVINFRDPLDFSLVNGKILDNSFHINRDKLENKYIHQADLIITSSQTNQKSLQSKYPEISRRIVNNHFGYIDQIKIKKKTYSTKVRIAYGGVFLSEQSPHILAEVASRYDDVEIIFIGNWQTYKPLLPYKDTCRFIPSLDHAEYLRFMMENVDIGFVSLTSDYLGACVPSKLYEYINLGLPILGALPGGDAKDIINGSGYGVAVSYDDPIALRTAILEMKGQDALQKYSSAVMRDRDSWAMENKINEVIPWLNAL